MSLNISDSLQVTELNRPTRVGELIGSIAQMQEIPNPRVGMMVYVEDEGKNYIVRSLKEKVINGVTVQNAQVDKYELFEGGGGTGEIADGSVTEKKLSTDVAGKLNTAYDKANLADTLFLNDGIVFKKGVLIEGGVRDSATDYAYSNKILGNGETITVDDGYRIINYKLYEDEKEALFVDNYNDTTIILDKGYVCQFSVMRDGGNAITNYNDIVKSFIRNPYAWDSNSNLNNFYCAGRYVISGSRKANATDNMPIYNGGNIEARLDILENENTLVQILTLLNVGGGDGNIYTRTRQNGSWGAWGKLQTNVEVGDINQQQMDDIDDNGIYSGVLKTTGETFVLVVINNYAIATQAGYGGYISHLKYSVGLDGIVKVETRRRDAFGSWTDWQGLSGGGTDYTLPVATKSTLGGIKSYENVGCLGDNAVGKEFAVNVNGNGLASVTIPEADAENIGVVYLDGEVQENSKAVTGAAVISYVEDAVEIPVVNHTETTVEIAPNVLNMWGEVAELNITLGSGKKDVANEYIIQFTSGETPTILALPNEIKWWNDKIPVIAENMTYQISILNGLAVFLYFKNSTT